MQFRKFTAGSEAYGLDSLPEAEQLSNVCFHDPKLEMHLKENRPALIRVLIFLSCCHTIVIDQKSGDYNASSPDELALINAAKQFGIILEERDENDNFIIHDSVNKARLKYQLLNVCEFTSQRKRMSCIFRDPKGQLILMCKGADSVIPGLLSQESLESQMFAETQEAVNQFATQGLRTLLLAERYLDEKEYF